MLGIAIIGEGLDGNATATIEVADDLKIFWVHQLDQVLHDHIHAVLVKVAMITEAEEIELQALALHHQHARDIINNEVSEIRLARLWA